MLVFLFVLVNGKATWEDPTTGLEYDWSSLSRKRDNYYEVIDSNDFFVPSIYSFNFDNNLPLPCTGQFPAAMETVELIDGWIESCSILGRSDMQEVKSLNNGVEVTYKGGDLCYEVASINNRQISFRLICSKTEGQWEIVQSTYDNYCHVILKKKTIAGCPQEYKFSWIWGFVLVIGAFSLYCIVGTLINSSKGNGVTLPNQEFWNGLIETTQETTASVIEKVKSFYKAKSLPAKGQNYEMV